MTKDARLHVAGVVNHHTRIHVRLPGWLGLELSSCGSSNRLVLLGTQTATLASCGDGGCCQLRNSAQLQHELMRSRSTECLQTSSDKLTERDLVSRYWCICL